MRIISIGALAPLAALLAAGCNATSPPETMSSVTALLTDAPAAGIQSATVWVSQVYLIGGGDSTGSRYTVDSTPREYDLLSLQNGVTAALGTAAIPTGTYEQMRFVVDSAAVTLAGGLQFSDGTVTRTLQVPSGAQTGIKVVFDAPVQVTAGRTVLVADFDVSRSFVLFGPSNAPDGCIFKPVIHATAQDVAASVSGTVTPAAADAKLYAIFTSDGDTVAAALADTSSGAYQLHFLPPGAYTIAAVGTGLSAAKSLTLRAGEDTTGVDLP
jgi:uncharacterized protein DUF4382